MVEISALSRRSVYLATSLSPQGGGLRSAVSSLARGRPRVIIFGTRAVWPLP